MSTAGEFSVVFDLPPPVESANNSRSSRSQSTAVADEAKDPGEESLRHEAMPDEIQSETGSNASSSMDHHTPSIVVSRVGSVAAYSPRDSPADVQERSRRPGPSPCRVQEKGDGRDVATVSEGGRTPHAQFAPQVDEQEMKPKHSASVMHQSLVQAEREVQFHVFKQADSGDKGYLTGSELRAALTMLGWNVGLSELLNVIKEVTMINDDSESDSSKPTLAASRSRKSTFVAGPLRSGSVQAVDLTDLETMQFPFPEFCLVTGLLQNQVRFEAFAAATEETVEHLEGALYVTHLLPDSPNRFYWNLCVVSATVYVFFMVGFQLTCYEYDTDDACRTLSIDTIAPDVVTNLILIVDLVCNLLTIYFKRTAFSRELVDETRELLWHNVWRWQFVVDLLSCLPFYLFGVFGAGRIGRFFSLVRVLKITVLHELFDLSSNLGTISPVNIRKYFVIGPAFVSFVQFASLVHATAIGCRLVGRRTYSEAVYISMYFYSTAGFGERDSKFTFGELWYFNVVLLIAMAVNALVIGRVIQFLSSGDIDSSRKERLLQLDAVLEFFDLPEGLSNEVRQMQAYLTIHSVLGAHGQLLECLPDDLKINMRLYERIRTVSQVPFFADTNASIRFGLAQLLMSKSFPPGQAIIYAGDVGTEMFFLLYGFVDVIGPKGQYLVTLKQGNYFGEVALLSSDAVRKASVVSLTYILTFVLYASDFDELVTRFPKFKAKLIQTANARVKETVQAARAKKEKDNDESDVPPPILIEDEPLNNYAFPSEQSLRFAGSINGKPTSPTKLTSPIASARLDDPSPMFTESGLQNVLLRHTGSGLSREYVKQVALARRGSRSTVVSLSEGWKRNATTRQTSRHSRTSMASEAKLPNHRSPSVASMASIFPHQAAAQLQLSVTNEPRAQAHTPRSGVSHAPRSLLGSQSPKSSVLEGQPQTRGAMAALERITGRMVNVSPNSLSLSGQMIAEVAQDLPVPRLQAVEEPMEQEADPRGASLLEDDELLELAVQTMEELLEATQDEHDSGRRLNNPE
jgi:hypothetical protein